MSRYTRIMMAILGVCVTTAHAQTTTQADALIRQGNKLYEQQKYKDATDDYQKALAKNPNYATGLFNLGNSLYQQKQYDASRQAMTATAKAAKDKTSKAGANYNIGNTYMAEQKWEDAINSYKQTLRNNPQDLDAKYNLSYAEQMMKKQQQKGGGGGGGNDKKDQKKDQQKQDQKKQDQQKKDDKNKQDQQNKDQQDKDKGDKDKQESQQQPQPAKLSQQQADQLLNALQNEEKKLQDKLNKEKGVPARMEKDW